MIDYTLHGGDLLTLGGMLVAAAYWIGRQIRSGYRHLYDTIDAHTEELSLHAGVLARMGWQRPTNAKFRPRAVSILSRQDDQL